MDRILSNVPGLRVYCFDAVPVTFLLVCVAVKRVSQYFSPKANIILLVRLRVKISKSPQNREFIVIT